MGSNLNAALPVSVVKVYGARDQPSFESGQVDSDNRTGSLN